MVDVSPILADAQGWEAAATVVLIASAYVLGVMTDRVADSLLTPFRNSISKHNADQRAAMRHRILESDTPLSKFLEYQRSRMRLMRGTLLNLIVAVPISALFLLQRGPDEPTSVIAIATVVLVGLLAACTFAFAEIVRAQDKWLQLVAGAREPDPGSAE